MEVDALIISVGDPQLERCLDAVRNQTVPFSNLIHLNNVCPEHVAFNSGMKQATGDWVMHIAGDVVLDLNALGKVINFIQKDWKSNQVSGYYFSLDDTFLGCRIGYIGALRSSLYRDISYNDEIIDDHKAVDHLRKCGWIIRKSWNITIGTHCDQPDELQVFSRCYLHGVRFKDHRSIHGVLINLLKVTGNPLYQLGIDAVEYGWKKNFYPGSHNCEFDRSNFEEFKCQKEMRA